MENKTTKAIVITVLVCLLLFGGAVVGMNWGRWFGDAPLDESGSTASRPGIDPHAGEYVPPEVSGQTGGEGIAIPGWGSITIPSGSTEVVVDFPNPEANAGKYYLSFELRLKETGEVLYTSGLVEPGLHIQRITLSRALEAGTYSAIIHVQPYKMDANLTATNNADMETKLIVVNP